jgi:hypothetical protein
MSKKYHPVDVKKHLSLFFSFCHKENSQRKKQEASNLNKQDPDIKTQFISFLTGLQMHRCALPITHALGSLCMGH